MATSMVASRKHVELSLELKRKLIQEHEHGVPFTLLGKKYHIATSTAANIWRKKDFFLRSRMSGTRKRCNDRSKYKIVNQVTALFVKSMLERNHKIDGEVIKRFARTAAAQCNFKDFHGSNGWLDSFKKRENVCWVRRRGERTATAANMPTGEPARHSDSPNLGAAAAAAAVAASAQQSQHRHSPHRDWDADSEVHGCARCNVAAAAAAVAALNSSDKIHERDHEIEDWFLGIPFLCQFFEDYQSIQPVEPSNGSVLAASTTVAISGSTSASSDCSSSSSTTRPALSRTQTSNQLVSTPESGSSNGIVQSRSASDTQELSETSFRVNEDQEFYQSSARFITQDDHQSDDLLYHDEVSDNNDCCSDHFDQSGSRELQIHDYPTELTNGASTGTCGTCYMDEYEYENISTIRHYPVPMPPTSQFASIVTDSVPDGNANGNSNNNPNELAQFRAAQLSQSGCQLETAEGCGRAENTFVASLTAATPGADYQLSNGSSDEIQYSSVVGLSQEQEQAIEHADHEEHNLLHNALMRSPEKLKLIDSIITLLNYASNYNQKMLAPLFEIKRCIERDLEVVLSDTCTERHQQHQAAIQQHQEQQQQQSSMALSQQGPAVNMYKEFL